MIGGSEQLLSLVFTDLYNCSLASDALVGSLLGGTEGWERRSYDVKFVQDFNDQ